MKCNRIYGIDPAEKITPIMVRDAIVECFFQAHKQILDEKDEYYSLKSKDELNTMKHTDVVILMESIMEENGDDFRHPTKKSLMKLVESLKKFAAKYRAEEVIQEHAGEIMSLVKKL